MPVAQAEGTKSVLCTACNIEHCRICKSAEDQLKNNKYVTCTLCETGYALVSGKCEQCPEKCSYCHEESRECQLCDKGFALTKQTNSCTPISLENCFQISDEGLCASCESHYYLTKEGVCEPCSKELQHCSYCTTGGEEFECASCRTGFSLNKNVCVQCPLNCDYCHEGKCTACIYGYYRDQESGQCTKCEIENCEYCEGKNVCRLCASGYYFDGKSLKCVRLTYKMQRKLS